MNEHPAELLSAHLDHELDDRQLTAVEAHLQTCAACQAQVQEVHALRRLLNETSAVPVRDSAAEFWRRLAPQLPAQQVGPQPSLGFGWIWGILMLVVTTIGQAILATLALTQVAAGLGFSLPVEPELWAGISNPVEPALRLLLENTLIGAVLNSDIGPFLPYLLILAIILGLTASFMGWVLASLQRSRTFVLNPNN